ncbi:RNA polymerase sigma-70 factor [Paenibacillus pinistramenti]|uniref:RNA polymerase sigma-70 factor n=1 Tax=Paenibacillus pinistramenti TaxID=1768003 RepID=UPI001EEFA8C8|nr:RNA polymerase sigma-70 factor [Paenibacillus pinistramenti]
MKEGIRVELDSVYRTYRPLLLSLAYRMLGTVTEAEDLVQDVFITVQQQNLYQEESAVRSLKAYLCKMVTNRCLDQLKSARKQREVYTGPWLPEPLVQDYAITPGPASAAGQQAQDPLQILLLEDTLSYAFLVMLERLTPVERAVFILREAFDFNYHEIADFVNRTEPGCRKIYSRLKRKIQEERPAEPFSSSRAEQLVLQFLHAGATGDMEGLLALLAEDIVLYSDGGGKVLAALRPVHSSQRVLAFIQGLIAKGQGQSQGQDGSAGGVRLVRVNGQPGLVLTSAEEAYPTVVSLEFQDDRIQRIYLIRNPDKLQHLKLSAAE